LLPFFKTLAIFYPHLYTMQIVSIVALAALAPAVYAQVTGNLGDAAIITGNPTNVTYEAVFDKNGTINGHIEISAGPGGEGASVKVHLSGFPTPKGPFSYHIHDQPVPADGNCTGTKAHLDPYQRGQIIPCDASQPQTCEVGDMTGKHGGKIAANTTEYLKEFTDRYLSLKSPSGAFIGNRSIVIHANDSSRIVCANFTVKGSGDHSNGGRPSVPSPTPGPNTPAGPAPGTAPSSAGRLGMSTFIGSALVGAVAFAML
jgi:Cu/Zn superoxide dismutase